MSIKMRKALRRGLSFTGEKLFLTTIKEEEYTISQRPLSCIEQNTMKIDVPIRQAFSDGERRSSEEQLSSDGANEFSDESDKDDQTKDDCNYLTFRKEVDEIEENVNDYYEYLEPITDGESSSYNDKYFEMQQGSNNIGIDKVEKNVSGEMDKEHDNRRTLRRMGSVEAKVLKRKSSFGKTTSENTESELYLPDLICNSPSIALANTNVAGGEVRRKGSFTKRRSSLDGKGSFGERPRLARSMSLNNNQSSSNENVFFPETVNEHILSSPACGIYSKSESAHQHEGNVFSSSSSSENEDSNMFEIDEDGRVISTSTTESNNIRTSNSSFYFHLDDKFDDLPDGSFDKRYHLYKDREMNSIKEENKERDAKTSKTPYITKDVNNKSEKTVKTNKNINKNKKNRFQLIGKVAGKLVRALSDKELTYKLDGDDNVDSDTHHHSWNLIKTEFNNTSSPGPTPRRGVSGLRQCDSLENICDTSRDSQRHQQNGLSAKAVATNAISLQNINRLSDYEEDEANFTREAFPSHQQLAHSRSEPQGPRSEKNKKTKLRRRRAYYRRDGRSKSLTHIDSLGGEGNMLLHSDSMEGPPIQDTLGVPGGDLTSLRRKKLSVAGKISSDDYVVVVLDHLQEPVEEFIPATRGTSLRSALERLGVELPAVQVVVEGTRAPLNLNTDINLLGGKTIRVRGRDESRSPSRSRSAGGGPAGRKISHVLSGPGRFTWGTSSEDYERMDSQDKNGSQDGSMKALKASTKSNNRWSIFPGNSKDTKMDSLVQQLDLYSKQGIPQLLGTPQPLSSDLNQDFHCCGSWREVVDSPELLDERQEQQQSAIWELVETEATHIHMLKVITDLFVSCLCNLQNESLLNEIDTENLFSNIQEIYTANVTFWQEHIMRMVEQSRSTGLPLDPTILTEGFYKFDEIFQPYTRYCLDQSNCLLYCKENDSENEYFKMYLIWCETQKECNRLRLVDILVQPMQRLTKYSLLLKAIAKKTDIGQHKIILQEMIHHVESFVSNVNSALRHQHERERLQEIAKRIEAYDVVDSREDELERVVRSYSNLNLTQPMPGCPEHLPRHLLHHGDLKLRDAHTSKMEVHVFLFTDLLLITKITQRKAEKVKIIRPPYHVARLIAVELKDITALGLVYINEWNVAVAAFTLQCPDIRNHRVWLKQIQQAQEQYNDAKQSRELLVFDDISYASNVAPHSPQANSYRASRVSSLAPSLSGSMELNEASSVSSVGDVGNMHRPSMDVSEAWASSVSSEDSGSHNPDIQRTSSFESAGGNTSPRIDRRSTTQKTSNNLSVNPPHSAGHSLPNLTEKSLRVPSTAKNSQQQLLTNNRGISYPPHSPRTLRRSAPVHQARSPPLIKSPNVAYNSGIPQVRETGESQDESPEDPLRGGSRSTVRTERLNNRRYHTAGVIDDIKKQDSKTPGLHKRLSLNYGQESQSPPPRELGTEANKMNRNNHRSCDSMQSSSGVSSTSSLHRSYGSELETLQLIDDNRLEGECSTDMDQPVGSEGTHLKLSPHISTTYICHDSEITVSGCSQYIIQPHEHIEELRVDGNTSGKLNIDMSESAENPAGISSVQIKVTERSSSSTLSDSASSDSSFSDGDSGTNTTHIRELLLNDASIEASDV